MKVYEGKHPDSEDESLERGWDGLGRLNPAVRNEGMHRARKQRAYILSDCLVSFVSDGVTTEFVSLG